MIFGFVLFIVKINCGSFLSVFKLLIKSIFVIITILLSRQKVGEIVWKKYFVKVFVMTAYFMFMIGP